MQYKIAVLAAVAAVASAQDMAGMDMGAAAPAAAAPMAGMDMPAAAPSTAASMPGMDMPAAAPPMDMPMPSGNMEGMGMGMGMGMPMGGKMPKFDNSTLTGQCKQIAFLQRFSKLYVLSPLKIIVPGTTVMMLVANVSLI